MSKRFLPLLFLLLASALPATTFTSKSLLFADSYMLRAQGADANYWNPALLSSENPDFWMPAANIGFFAGNNSLNIDLYNFIMSEDYLDDEDKQRILDAIDDKLAFNFGGQIGLFGFTLGDLALSGSVHLAARAALTEKIVELALYGNGDGSQVYEFTKDENYVDALSYADVTLGWGDIRLPLPKVIPDIEFGIAVSALAGLGSAETAELTGFLSSNLDGLNIEMDALQRTAAGGAGFKALLGLHSEPLKNLHVGITLDNVLGFIRWNMLREDFAYHFAADSVYVSDIQEDIEDLYTDEYTQTEGDPFTTTLPPELRVAVLYHTRQASFSADLIKGFGEAENVSRKLRYAVGAELTPIPFLPIHLGYGSGNDGYPWRMSYGLGLRFKVVELGLGIQSIETILPGTSSKGIAFATYFNLRF